MTTASATQTGTRSSSASWNEWERREYDRLTKSPLTRTDRLWADRSLLLSWGGMAPDPWQSKALNDRRDLMFCCSRQVGKSQVAAAISLTTATLEPGSLILLLSPT